MAFKRKDLKKASYYVWFLGTKESKGLRGDEYVVPVLRFLLDQERQYEPSKVTLQVSNKGLKIVQTLTVPKKSGSAAKSGGIGGLVLAPKTEQIKHMIPHHSITWVSQEEDIICSILLIYNPITKCPVHVHAYRCDSIETAATLRNQLQILIDRPENQKKFREIETRLAAKGLMANAVAPALELSAPSAAMVARKPLNSDGRSTRTEGSENSDESIGSSDLGYNGKDSSSAKNSAVKVRRSASSAPVSTLYESLAVELRAKLGNPKTGPILLPPRDYDTISRKRGKLEGIELRKSTNSQIVGPLDHISSVTRADSSGKSSSGISSEEALSSAIHEIHGDYDRKVQTISSDEDDDDWIIERKGRSCRDLSVARNAYNASNHCSLKKVSSLNPIAQKLDKHLLDRARKSAVVVASGDSDRSPAHRQPHHKSAVSKVSRQSPPPSTAQRPAQLQRYYFPDPAFSVPDAQQSRSKLEQQQQQQRLHRHQSNPDYFHQIRALSPHASPRNSGLKSPPTAQTNYERAYDYRGSRGRLNFLFNAKNCL